MLRRYAVLDNIETDANRGTSVLSLYPNLRSRMGKKKDAGSDCVGSRCVFVFLSALS